MIYSFSEYGYVSIDVYICGYLDFIIVVDYIVDVLSVQICEIIELLCGMGFVQVK